MIPRLLIARTATCTIWSAKLAQYGVVRSLEARVYGGEPLKNDIGGVTSVHRWVGEKDFIQPLLSKDEEERQDGKPSVVWNTEYLKSNVVNVRVQESYFS